MSIDFIWGANQTTDIESLAKIGIKQVYIGYIGNSSKHYPVTWIDSIYIKFTYNISIGKVNNQ